MSDGSGPANGAVLKDAGGVGHPPNRRGGGTGIAGGTDLHAMALVLAAVALMRGSRLGWLDKVALDVPVAVTAETGGPGDDIGLELQDGSKVEVQSKKGLTSRADLWTALEQLIDGVSDGTISHGVLVVSADSSKLIREDLAKDLVLIGQGQIATLTEIGESWLRQLQCGRRNPAICAHVRIRTLYLLDGDGADQRTALVGLQSICAHPSQAEAALAHLYRDAIALQKSRGRWTLATLTRLLSSYDIELRTDGGPIAVAAKLAGWAEKVNAVFSLPAGMRTIPIVEMLPAAAVATSPDPQVAENASVALERYHSGEVTASDDHVYEGAWLGRFRPLAVVIAGPGLGKSTLARRLAWENARDGAPVLIVPLAAVAAAMRTGTAFEDALWNHGLSGSGISTARARDVLRGEIVVVADGLDEAGEFRDRVAAGLVDFAKGAPGATMIVTTRPIGYDTARLADWLHYRLRRPEPKDGVANLGRLVALGRGLTANDADSLALAESALAGTSASDAIVLSPLLLGMAASLIIRDQRLPRTRPALYEALIGLFETREALPSDVTTSLGVRVLDIVGWELLGDPRQDQRKLEQSASEILAKDLGTSPLAAATHYAAAFKHWERVGVVELLQFGGKQLVSFTHRTFAEFAAARFLVGMGAGRGKMLGKLVDDPSFAEVISFAGALGIGDEIAQLFVERRDRGSEGQFERALELAGDHDAEVSDEKVLALVDAAFDVVASPSLDRFSVGLALAELALRRPLLVGPVAYLRLEDADPAVRLAATACVVRSQPERLEAGHLAELLTCVVEHMPSPPAPPSSGAWMARSGKNVALLDIVALAALKAQPVADMDRFRRDRLSGERFDRFGFQSKVEAVLVAKGLKTIDGRWERYALSSTKMLAMLAPDSDWNIAANRVTRAIASAVASSEQGGSKADISRLPQFSALHQVLGVRESESFDVQAWASSYDEQAVGEVIRAVVSLTTIDPVTLGSETRAVLDALAQNPDRSPLLAGLKVVDVPEPEWSKVSTLELDRRLVEAAFHHGSSWLTFIAAKLLVNMPASRDDHVRLLDRSLGLQLHYATEIVASGTRPEEWSELVLTRLTSGTPTGIQHILKAVAKYHDFLPRQTAGMIEAGLKSDNSAAVEAAAKLGVIWLSRGGSIAPGIAEAAYRGTLGGENGKADGSAPTGVAVAALELLLAAGLLKGDILDLALADQRSAPRDVARRSLALTGKRDQQAQT